MCGSLSGSLSLHPFLSSHLSYASSGPISPRPSPAPWLCAGNERSRHVLSGLRPWKAGRQSEVKPGEADLAWTHTPLWAWDGHQKAQPEVFEERGHGEGEELGDRGMSKCNHHRGPTFCWVAVYWWLLGKTALRCCSGMELWRKKLSSN